MLDSQRATDKILYESDRQGTKPQDERPKSHQTGLLDVYSRDVSICKNSVDVVKMKSKQWSQIHSGLELAKLLSAGEGEVLVEAKVPAARTHWHQRSHGQPI